MVETGVAQGFSTYATLSAMKKNGKGKLFSIDYPTTYQDVGWLPRDKFDNWKLIVGKSKDELPNLLEKLGKIDCFLHDSEHRYENMMFEFKLAWKYLRKGGVLLCDEPTNAFYDFIKKVNPSSSFTVPSRIPQGIIIK
jgi:predicted O-methyltransferase YrrM